MTYRLRILTFLKEHGRTTMPRLLEELVIPYDTLRVTLTNLKKDGLVLNPERGTWELSDAGAEALDGNNLTPPEVAMLDAVALFSENAVSNFVELQQTAAHVATRFLNALRAKGMVQGFDLTDKGQKAWENRFLTTWARAYEQAHTAWRERATAVFERLAKEYNRPADPRDTWLFQMTVQAMGDDREPTMDDFDPEVKGKAGEEEEGKEAA